ncbi:uncharacterized protein PV09_02913 [Verruconis gallopava]|uniref:Uncharacterized protein n=1 Tax=Verruconis gallopava TaxID=253628 RepID=A0A0D1XUQ6_9PEZI|nr:uncharacterized protein PV09_02913 [Verruconis gallopava]KIW06476.1 hypothetical protein PV09_02913 [Verruconis gallopava]
MDRKRDEDTQIHGQETGQKTGNARRKGRRRQSKCADVEKPPKWDGHYFSNPQIFVRDLAAYTIPRVLPSLHETPPLPRPQKKSFWLFGMKNFIEDCVEFEVDKQLRQDLGAVEGPRRHVCPSSRLSGFVVRADRYFSYATEMVAHEVEKEIRKWVRRHDGHQRILGRAENDHEDEHADDDGCEDENKRLESIGGQQIREYGGED